MRIWGGGFGVKDSGSGFGFGVWDFGAVDFGWGRWTVHLAQGLVGCGQQAMCSQSDPAVGSELLAREGSAREASEGSHLISLV